MTEQNETNFTEYIIDSEYRLTEYIISHSDEIPVTRAFPALLKKEYHVYPPFTQYGVGDLIFKDNSENNFLIVEVKYLSRKSGRTARTKRNKYRNKVWKQAIFYAYLFKYQHPEAHVFYVGITEENLYTVKMREMKNL